MHIRRTFRTDKSMNFVNLWQKPCPRRAFLLFRYGYMRIFSLTFGLKPYRDIGNWTWENHPPSENTAQQLSWFSCLPLHYRKTVSFERWVLILHRTASCHVWRILVGLWGKSKRIVGVEVAREHHSSCFKRKQGCVFVNRRDKGKRPCRHNWAKRRRVWNTHDRSEDWYIWFWPYLPK